MLLCSLLTTFYTSAVVLVFGNAFSKNGVVNLTIWSLRWAILCSLSTLSLILDRNFHFFGGSVKTLWFQVNGLLVSWGFLFDALTIIMMCLVLTISLAVHFFSVDYMSTDPHFNKFFGYLHLFTSCMLLLITADNLFQLFLGWEGVGLCSYLLITFWYTRVQANKAAIKALLVNKVGDISLLLGIVLLAQTTSSSEISFMYAVIPSISNLYVYLLSSQYHLVTSIAFFFLLGAVGKSAQLGLHIWLPDAMEGPTPVSALIHAATMVTAGIYLIVRCSIIFQTANQELSFLMVLFGVFTALFSAMVGLFQSDIKKVIAYSTCSQLGYMFFICGFSQYVLSFYHVITHAFFKALLFLTAGSILHVLNDEQDIRKMGKIKKLYRFYTFTFLIGSLALTGFPFLAGFYSKDLILESAFSFFLFKGLIGYLFGVIAALFSALYSVKLMTIVFFSHNKSNKFNFYNLTPVASRFVLQPLTFLSIAAIFFGYLLSELFIGIGTDIFQNTVVEQRTLIFDHEMITSPFKNLPLFITLFGFFWSPIFWFTYPTNNALLPITYRLNTVGTDIFHTFFNHLNLSNFFIIKGGFDAILSVLIRHILRESYLLSFALLDKLLLEKFGPFGISKITLYLGRLTTLLQTGSIVHYFSLMIMYLIFVLIAAVLNVGLAF